MHPRHIVSGAGLLALVYATSPVMAGESYLAMVEGVEAIQLDPSLSDLLPPQMRDASLRSAIFSNLPFAMQDDDGALFGAGIDFTIAIAKTLGLELAFGLTKDVATTKVSVKGGRYNVATGPLLDTPVAEKDFYILPWARMQAGFLLPANHNHSDLVALCGKGIAIVSGSVSTELASKSFAAFCEDKGQAAPVVTSLGSQDAVIVSVLSGRQDAAIMASAAALYIAGQQPEKYTTMSWDNAGIAEVQLSGFMLAKQDAGFETAFLAAMTALAADGTYGRIMRHYGLEAIAIETFTINPLTSSTATEQGS